MQGTTTAFANGAITGTICDDPVLDEIGWYCGNVGGWTHPVDLECMGARESVGVV